MKAVHTVIIAAGLLLTSGAYAQGIQNDGATSPYQFNNDIEQPSFSVQQFAHPKTRAQVVQDLQSAKAAGQIWQGESDYGIPAAGTVSGVSRAQVLKELAEAKAAGKLTEGELNYPATS